MKRQYIYYSLNELKYGIHITHMIQEAISSGKRFFLWNDQIYFLTANYGAETTGLDKNDIVD